MSIAIDDADTGSTVFFVIVDNGMNYGIRSHGHFLGLHGPGNSRCIGAKVGAIDTPTIAHGLILTFTTALLDMDSLRIGKVCTSTCYKMTIRKMFGELRFKISLYMGYLKGWLHDTIWQFVDAIAIAGDTCKLLHMIIPRCEVFVPDRPIHCKTIPGRSFKIIITPALGLPGP